MTFRSLRPCALLALTLALSGCGGSASFTVDVTVEGLVYDGLILTETVSGRELKIAAPSVAKTTVKTSFPMTLKYGDQYKVVMKKPTEAAPTEVDHRPAHQECDLDARAADTAGRLATINVVVNCRVRTLAVSGSVSPEKTDITGLQITNGTGPTFTGAASGAGYSFPGILYGTSYGPVISKQPDNAKITCAFVAPATTPPAPFKMGPDNLSFSGIMGDDAVTVNLACNTAP